MKTTVVHCKREPFDVYIGRAKGPRGKWGNPFSHLPGTLAQFRVMTREEAISRYEQWILTQPQLLADLSELRGKVLGCWCKPLACHGDVLARLADSSADCEVWWLSCHRMTVKVETVDGRVVAAKSAPIVSKFNGQPIANVIRWMKSLGGFKSHRFR